MEQQERFQGVKEGNHGVSRPRCLPFLCLTLLGRRWHSSPSRFAACSPAHLRSPCVLDMRWGGRRGEWECNSRFGSVGELQSKKIDESSRRQWKACWRGSRQHLYPNLMSPRPAAPCSSLPCWCSLCLECPCRLECSHCPLRTNSHITWKPLNLLVLLLCAILFQHRFWCVCLHVSIPGRLWVPRK